VTREEWSGDAIVSSLRAALAQANWAPTRDDFDPIYVGREVAAADMIAVTANVLGRDSPSRIRLLTYFQRDALARKNGGELVDVGTYCRSIGWSRSAFYGCIDKVRGYLNARGREVDMRGIKPCSSCPMAKMFEMLCTNCTVALPFSTLALIAPRFWDLGELVI
jgi:hypothetical protein